ncbi:MAG: hypothetical protein NMNS01_13130 [Nitrosomonas sp.]|nr:MAG: hypothetical protein NMNS01_13130 [Nitrosomonas sp.]
MNVLLVEDNPIHAVDIARIIDELGYELVSTVDNSEDFFKVLEPSSLDLILMDIDIKGAKNGIELAGEIEGLQIPIIFLTAFDSQTIYQRAKEVMPAGYLVKPFNKITLQSTIELAFMRNRGTSASSQVIRLWSEDLILNENFFIKANDKLVKVNVPKIGAIEADGNYSMIYTAEKKLAAKISLRKIRLMLSPRLFIQVHRKYIVNFNNIEDINMVSLKITVFNKQIPIGAKYKNDFLNRLNKMESILLFILLNWYVCH